MTCDSKINLYIHVYIHDMILMWWHYPFIMEIEYGLSCNQVVRPCQEASQERYSNVWSKVSYQPGHHLPTVGSVQQGGDNNSASQEIWPYLQSRVRPLIQQMYKHLLLNLLWTLDVEQMLLKVNYWKMTESYIVLFPTVFVTNRNPVCSIVTAKELFYSG